MKKKMILPLIALIAITFSACRKYEEGPGISLLSRKRRVENSWFVEKCLVNGADSTAVYAQYYAGEFYDLDGNYRTLYARHIWGVTPAEVYGTWEFQNRDREIKRTLSDGTIEIIEIIRLKNNSFWYRTKCGNDVVEFHLTNDQRDVPQ